MQTDPTPVEADNVTDGTILELISDDDVQRPWSVDEIVREMGSRPTTIDGLGRLYGSGLTIAAATSCGRHAPRWPELPSRCSVLCATSPGRGVALSIRAARAAKSQESIRSPQWRSRQSPKSSRQKKPRNAPPPAASVECARSVERKSELPTFLAARKPSLPT
jgi:hypothetical protein